MVRPMNSPLTTEAPFSLLSSEIQAILGNPGASRTLVRLIFASTINASSSIDGVSGPLGNELDYQVLLAARALADVVLVGANTVREENYGGLVLSNDLQQARVVVGQEAVPPIAILSRKGNFSPESTVVAASAVPPILIRSHADAQKYPSPAVEAGVCRELLLPDISGAAVIHALQAEGFLHIVCEGGPILYSRLLKDDCADVLNWTIDPSIVFASGSPILGLPPDTAATGEGSPAVSRLPFDLRSHVACPDGVLFLRYERRRSSAEAASESQQ